ncbi:MAG: RNA polymerase sigma factor [Solirubrobacteraceae bacterium]
MDELTGLCTRLLGGNKAATQAARRAREAEGRVGQLAAALANCRALRDDPPVAGQPAADPRPDAADPRPDAADPRHEAAELAVNAGLAGAVAQELGTATARLPQRQQEALALRELLGLSHELVAEVLGIDPAAVTALLARSRTRLHAELRGVKTEPGSCPERDRTARTATLRQDGQPVSTADEDWLLDHLGHCDGCRRLHATMLEASVCYRAWPVSLADPGRAITAA